MQVRIYVCLHASNSTNHTHWQLVHEEHCLCCGCVLQFLGDADVVQELEDFGQLDAALTGQLITH